MNPSILRPVRRAATQPVAPPLHTLRGARAAILLLLLLPPFAGCSTARPPAGWLQGDTAPGIPGPSSSVRSRAVEGSAPAVGEPRPAEPGDDSPWEGFFALGPGAAPSFEGASEYQPIPFGVIRLSKGGIGFETEGLAGRFDVVPDLWSSVFRAGPSFEVRLAREDVEDDQLAALDSVDTAFEVGAFVGAKLPNVLQARDELELRLTVNRDVTATHQGVVGEFAADYAFFPEQNIRIGFGVDATAASARFMDTYFGVDAEGSAASGLDVYSPGGGLRSLGAQANVLFLFQPNFGVFGYLSYDRLLGEPADSPVVRDVGSADQFLGGLSAVYRF